MSKKDDWFPRSSAEESRLGEAKKGAGINTSLKGFVNSLATVFRGAGEQVWQGIRQIFRW